MWNQQFVDTINILDFLISLQNLQQNDKQTDMQKVEEHFNTKLQMLLGEIHSHLEAQDKKLDMIMKKLEGNNHDS